MHAAIQFIWLSLVHLGGGIDPVSVLRAPALPNALDHQRSAETVCLAVP